MVKSRTFHLRVTRQLATLTTIEKLERRWVFSAPSAPIIIEPFTEGQITGTFDLNMQTDPSLYSDPDNNAWQSTEWIIRRQSDAVTVWQTGFLSAPPLTLYRVDFSDGTFTGPLAGKSELSYSTNYQLSVRYRDSNSEISSPSLRNFTTASATEPVPGAGTWLVRPGYVVEPVQTGLRLPVNIAFVPNPGTNPTDPLYYVAELYGSIQVVRNNGARSTFATGLLDYNPEGPISGTGEQGLTGLAVERDSVNPNIYNLYVAMLWDNGAPPGGPNHYPKVERLTSAVGGLTMSTRTVLLNMQPETQGQSHQISNVTIGPDNKLYVHVGDGFDASTGLNLDQYRGKVLRMNKNGAPVATGDPAGANPFYNAANGINARDYVFTYGHRNPFGGAWRPATNQHWIVENGNSIDRMVDLVSGASYGWAGNDTAIQNFSKYIWNPSTAPVNIDFVDSTKFAGSMYPSEAFGHAFVTLSGSTYAPGVLQNSKSIVEFPDLTTLNGSGKLANEPINFVKYNGTGRASVAAIAAGPDGLYFSDLYEDTGVSGATAPGANVYRIRYVGNAGGQIPTVATPAAATPNPITAGTTTQLSVLGADDGGEANLTYTWTTIGNPPAPVSFSVNASNAAKNTTATFTANGTYNLYVLIRDAGEQTAISSVVVSVSSLLTETGDGLSAAYYDNINHTALFQTRIDPSINFNWGATAPIAGMGADAFSVRWTGFVVPRFSQTYTFYTTSDDGARLWVNNLTTPLVDAYFDQGATQSYSGAITLNAGQIYAIKYDYYENAGAASAKLEWSSTNQPREVVPQGRLYTVAPTVPNAPTNLQLNAPLPSQVNLSWTDNASNESGFKVQRSLDGTAFATIATVAAGVTAFSDTGLSAGTQYFYRVRATNPAGDSNFAADNITTPGGFPTTYNGTGAADIFYLRRIGADLGVWIGSNGVGSPTHTTLFASAPALTFNGNDGADSLTIDNIDGSAIPSGGITFNGNSGSDTLAFRGSNSADAVIYTATTMQAGATVTHNSVQQRTFAGNGGGDSLTVNAGAVATISNQSIASLAVAPGATLDLNDNDLLIDYGGISPLPAVQALISTARNGGDWTGTGITSTAARLANPAVTALGLMEATDYKSIYGPDATFNGESLDNDAVLIKYTYYGDTDFNGFIDFDDYVRIDTGFNSALTGWINGDADLNGFIDFDDYVLIDSSFNSQGLPL